MKNLYFKSNKWLSLWTFAKKDSKVQNEILQTIEKYNNEPYETLSKMCQNSLIESKVFEQTISIMVDTSEDLDIEIEQKDNKTDFLKNKIGLPNSIGIEEMN